MAVTPWVLGCHSQEQGVYDQCQEVRGCFRTEDKHGADISSVHVALGHGWFSELLSAGFPRSGSLQNLKFPAWYCRF